MSSLFKTKLAISLLTVRPIKWIWYANLFRHRYKITLWFGSIKFYCNKYWNRCHVVSKSMGKLLLYIPLLFHYVTYSVFTSHFLFVGKYLILFKNTGVFSIQIKRQRQVNKFDLSDKSDNNRFFFYIKLIIVCSIKLYRYSYLHI